jgi:hypothetical protein
MLQKKKSYIGIGGIQNGLAIPAIRSIKRVRAAVHSDDIVGIRARRLHQRKQLVHRGPCELPDALAVEPTGDPDLPDHRMDFVSEVAEKAKRVFRIVRNSRNQSRHQNLTSYHAAVQLFHFQNLTAQKSPHRIARKSILQCRNGK